MTRYWQLIVCTCAVLLAGCAALEPTQPAPTTTVSSNTAVQNLYDRAAEQYRAGDAEQARSTLERAVRIEPGNAHLWFELAQLARQDGELTQARELAFRAQSLAGGDTHLRGRIEQFLKKINS